MRILIAHNDYGAPSGEEYALQALAALLSTNGHSVCRFSQPTPELVSLRGKARAFVAGLYSLRSRTEMTKALLAERPHIVQAQNLFPFLSPSVLAASHHAGVPVVMRCPNYRLFCPSGLHLSHGEICERCLGGKEFWCLLRNCEGDLFKSLGYALRNAVARISRSIVDNVKVFVVLSEFQKRRFIQGGIQPEQVEILPNIAPDVGVIAQEGPSNWVTFVGRASPEKGIEDFVSAARALPDLPFVVAGETERMPELVTRSPGNVNWLGFLKEKELNDVYARSRLLVFPFRWFEGFPNVVTRAMVTGKPVIASRIGALPEIVRDGKTGVLFELGNVEELVTQIKRFYGDEAMCREMGRAGRAKAQAEYSPEVVYARLMEIYQKALGHAL